MLNSNDKAAIARLLNNWAENMRLTFHQRFGENKIGHLIIALDTGSEPTVTYSTNLRDDDLKRLVTMLAAKLNERKILRPYDA